MSDIVSIQELLKDTEVEWKSLKEVAVIGTGSHDTKDALDSGTYIFYARGRKPLKLNLYDFDEIAIITAGDGVGVGKVFHWAEGKYALHQRAYRIVPNAEVNPRYVYYYILANFYSYVLKTSVHSSVSSLRKPMFLKFPIPIPSLKMQGEIVKILDTFRELTEELTARKKQYEFYRNELLTFENEEVEFKTLSEVAKIKNGKDWKKLKKGNIPVYGSGGIMCFVDTPSYSDVSVLIPRKGTITNIFYTEEPFWNVDTIFYTMIDEKIIVPKYFYYFMSNYNLIDLSTDSTRPSLTQKILNKIIIPIPSITEQKRIVSILDKFDMLTNSISEGLPKEIKLRQQQYEYYRDLLLTFSKQAVEV